MTESKTVLIKLIFRTNLEKYSDTPCFFQKYHLTNTDVAGHSVYQNNKYTDNFIRIPTDIKLTSEIASLYDSNEVDEETTLKHRVGIINCFFDDYSFTRLLQKFKAHVFSILMATQFNETASQQDKLTENLLVVLNFFFANKSFFYLDGKRFIVAAVHLDKQKIKESLKEEVEEKLIFKNIQGFKSLLDDDDDDENEFLNRTKFKNKEILFVGSSSLQDAIHKETSTRREYVRAQAKKQMEKMKKNYAIYEVHGITIDLIEDTKKDKNITCKRKIELFKENFKKYFGNTKSDFNEKHLFEKHNKYKMIPFKSFVPLPAQPAAVEKPKIAEKPTGGRRKTKRHFRRSKKTLTMSLNDKIRK